MNKHEKEREELAKQLGIDLEEGEEISKETLEELSSGKGDEEDE